MPVKIERFNKKTGKTEVKEYTTVAERLKQLNENTKGKYDLTTEIIKLEGEIVCIKATLKIPERGTFTGLAYERSGDGNFINKTSHVENAESSAWGRCMAAAGYLGTEICSAEELANAIKQQNNDQKDFKKSYKPVKLYDAKTSKETLARYALKIGECKKVSELEHLRDAGYDLLIRLRGPEQEQAQLLYDEHKAMLEEKEAK